MRNPISAFRHLEGRARNFLRRQGERIVLRRRVRENIGQLRAIKASLRPGQKLVCIGLVERMGDLIAGEPVARYARQKYPSAHIIWVVRRPYYELVSAHPALDGIIIVDSITEYSRISRADVAHEFIDLHVNELHCYKFGTIHRKTKGNLTVTDSNYYEHGSLLHAFCKSAGVPPIVDGPELHLPVSAKTAISMFLPKTPFIVFHPSSNEPTRDWVAKNWVDLISLLSAELGVTFVEVGMRSTTASHVPGTVDLCGKLTPPQLAEFIRQSSGFIGIDSGPAHMANASRRPSLILMGRYRTFDRYMPYTGFLLDNAPEMLLWADGPAALLPLDHVVASARKVFASLHRSKLTPLNAKK